MGDPPAERAARRGRAGLRRLVAVLLALPFAVGADGPQADTVPEKVRAELRAAHRARTRRAEAEQAWAAEKERLSMLVSAVRRRAERLRAEAEEAAAERDALAEEVEALSARERRLREVEAMLDALAERFEKALAALAAEALPGLVPADTAAGITDPARRFDALVQRLGDTERRLGSATVEIVTGTLDGREVTVKLLRAGGAAAWWIALDGERAGTARRADGRLNLTPARTPEAVEALRKAFAMAEGRAAPGWVILPADHLEAE